MDFAVQVDKNKVKVKESEMINKYLVHARERKSLWNMAGMMIYIYNSKGELEIRGRIETIQTTAPEYLNNILELWGILLSLRIQYIISNLIKYKRFKN